MTTLQAEAIRKHGENLLAIFPDASEQDPVKLCKLLRKYESKLHSLAVQYCNGGIDSEHIDEMGARILSDVADILGDGAPIHFNRDPRGYALKIDDEWMRLHNVALARDWGGYGLIAPEIGPKGWN